jgi:hypothetical protein
LWSFFSTAIMLPLRSIICKQRGKHHGSRK